MFENLQEKLELALKKISGKATITEDNIAEALKEIRKAFLDADVNFKVANDFVQQVKVKALGTKVKGMLRPEQVIVKIVHDELVETMGNKNSELMLAPQPPTIILVAGLQGSGKTTFCAKMAKNLRKKGRQPLLVACDIHRPAAILQLKQLGEQINIPVFSEDNSAPQIAQNAIQYAKKFARDVVIIDTAGRLTIDEEMMQEVKDVSLISKPTETLFVCDAMIGQDAVNTAKAFNDLLSLTGVVLTKMDGDTRGGAALSVLKVVGAPIKFVGVGEKIDDLEPFYPDRIASRILGMGDILTLVERAEREIDDKKAEELEEKIRKNQFTFDDFLDQLKMLKKMGNIKDLVGMLPGMDKKLIDTNVDNTGLIRMEAIINSMTKQERSNPKIINGSRRMRIARGSGNSVQQVNMLLKKFEDMQKMMKSLSLGKKSKMSQQFKKWGIM
ncbi:MAG: signal recognition particle protein [Bacteroidetes bacterium]|nr:signal recognition particle protein [Bacteroidota bacterium]